MDLPLSRLERETGECNALLITRITLTLRNSYRRLRAVVDASLRRATIA